MMNNDFQKSLRLLFGEDDEILDNTKYVGRKCYGDIDDELRLSCQLLSTDISNQYNAIKLTVIKRDEGVVDCLVIKFCDVFKDTSAHLWYNKYKLWWHPREEGTDLTEGIDKLKDSIKDYVSVFKPRNNKAPLDEPTLKVEPVLSSGELFMRESLSADIAHREQILRRLDIKEEDLRLICKDAKYIVMLRFKNHPPRRAIGYSTDSHRFTIEGISATIEPATILFNEDVEDITIIDSTQQAKTYLSDFLEKYPNAKLDEGGIPEDICPHFLGLKVPHDEKCLGVTCKKCWGTPIACSDAVSGKKKI